MEIPVPEPKARGISLRERNYVAEIVEAVEALPIGAKVKEIGVKEDESAPAEILLRVVVTGQEEADDE